MEALVVNRLRDLTWNLGTRRKDMEFRSLALARSALNCTKIKLTVKSGV